jgi:hypothetical protein
MPTINFTQWGFMYAPLDVLLDKLSARLVEIQTPGDGFFGGVIQRDRDLVIVLDGGMGQPRKDVVTRSLLANWYGVEFDGQPPGMCITELDKAA